MSLATRCTSCATVFRVVQDQLKVSEGWVRCGRCDTVFNALEQLFDLDRETLPADALTGEPPQHDSLPDLPPPDAPKPPLAGAFDAMLRERAPAREAPRSDVESRSDVASRSDIAPRTAAAPEPIDIAAESVAADANVDFLLDVPGDHAPTPGPAAPPTTGPADAAADHDTPPPEFLRHAERAARWQQPRVRWALGVAAGLLVALLALQAAHHFRDTLAVRWPQAVPLLEAWCGIAGCRIEPPRRIADVTVENTGLVPAAAGPGSFQFSVTLRNRGRWPVAVPAIDLSLTDSNGQLVARRALTPAELTAIAMPAGGAPAPLKPDTDTRLAATLATTSRVAGYTVEVFYP